MNFFQLVPSLRLRMLLIGAAASLTRAKAAISSISKTPPSSLPLCCQAAEIVVTNTGMTADTAANLDGTW